MGSRSFPGIKWLGCGVSHTPLLAPRSKKEYSYNFPLPLLLSYILYSEISRWCWCPLTPSRLQIYSVGLIVDKQWFICNMERMYFNVTWRSILCFAFMCWKQHEQLPRQPVSSLRSEPRISRIWRNATHSTAMLGDETLSNNLPSHAQAVSRRQINPDAWFRY
jgi:hypothetical protein